MEDARALGLDEVVEVPVVERLQLGFGEVGPGQLLVELVKLQVKTVTLNRSFDESKESIRSRMARERRSRDYDEWMKKLRESAKVIVNEGELEKVQVEGSAPQMQPAALPRPNPMAPQQQTPPTAASKIGGN